jgi:hypothetical protein
MLSAGGVAETVTDEDASPWLMKTSHRHLGILLGLGVHAQTSMVGAARMGVKAPGARPRSGA